MHVCVRVNVPVCLFSELLQFSHPPFLLQICEARERERKASHIDGGGENRPGATRPATAEQIYTRADLREQNAPLAGGKG